MKKIFFTFASFMAICVLLFIGSNAPGISGFAMKTADAQNKVPLDILIFPQGTVAPATKPEYGGTLKTVQTRSITNLGSPWEYSTPAERSISRFAIENLVGLDSRGNPVPQLATSWAVDQGAKTITFSLRQGVKFHDGTDFNAEAVKWNLEKYRKSKKLDLKSVKSIDVLDAYRIRLTLKNWDPTFIQNLSFSTAGRIVSPTHAQKLMDYNRDVEVMRTPVGTGPFKFVSYVPNVSVKYTRFENYWQKGLPYLDAVEVYIILDQMVAMAAYKKGDVNHIRGIQVDEVDKLKAAGDVIITSIASISGITGNSKNPKSPFADINVRRAIAYGINSEAMVKEIFHGYNPTTNQLALKGKSGWNPAINGYPYNPEKAKELLAAAGYTDEKPLKLKLIYTKADMLNEFYTVLQNNFKKIGVDLQIAPMDNAQRTRMVNTGWDTQLVDYRFSYSPIEIPYSSSLRLNLAPDGAAYVSIQIPDDYAVLYDKMLKENDLSKREVDYQQLNKLAIDKYCLVIPTHAITDIKAYKPYLRDCGLGEDAIEFSPQRIWIKK